MSETRKDICFDEQLKKEFIETLNFMVGLIPVLKANNSSSNEMIRLEELIKTKTEDLSSLERSKEIIKDKDTKRVISSSITKVKTTISMAVEAKKDMSNSFFESSEKIRLYRSYAEAKWEYFENLKFTFSKTEIENLTDEKLIGYFLFEGMGTSRRKYSMSWSTANNERLSFIRAYEESWNTFLEWIYTNI